MLRLAIIVVLASCVFAQVNISPSNANLQWSGRVYSNSTGTYFDWSGVQVSLQVTGTTSIQINLVDSNNYYNVFVDGVYQGYFSTVAGTTTYPVVSTLIPTQQHHIKITKRTEAEVNSNAVICTGFILDAGNVITTIPRLSRRIEFLGDSITCGYGNMANSSTCPSGSQEGYLENNYLTWGQILARYFAAEVHIESWSGKGLVRNYADPNTESPNPFPIYWNRTVGEDAQLIYNFTQFVPDAVVINLGTNDYSTEPTPSQVEFQTAYRTFLQTIRESYNKHNMIFFLACGPMIGAPCCYYVENVVRHEHDTYFLNLQNLLDSNDIGCDGHPNVAGHNKMAYASIPVISAITGW